MSDLRAYVVPPWRAEEWFHYSQLQENALTNRTVAINGQPLVPPGHRGVIKRAYMSTIKYCGITPCAAPRDTGGNGRWTLSKNGVVIPGMLDRPSCFMLQGSEFIPGVAGDGGMNGSQLGYIGGLVFDLLVPIKLRGGDVLTYTTTNGTAQTSYLVFLQGWIWPAANEDESAEGSAADPWP